MPKNLLSLQQTVGYLPQIFLPYAIGIFCLQEKLLKVFLGLKNLIKDFFGFKSAEAEPRGIRPRFENKKRTKKEKYIMEIKKILKNF